MKVPGLAYTICTRGPGLTKFACKNLPPYYKFIIGRSHEHFKWRQAFEKRLDELHDATWAFMNPGRTEYDMHTEENGGVENEELKKVLQTRGLRGIPKDTEEKCKELHKKQTINWNDLYKAFKPPPKKAGQTLHANNKKKKKCNKFHDQY